MVLVVAGFSLPRGGRLKPATTGETPSMLYLGSVRFVRVAVCNE